MLQKKWCIRFLPGKLIYRGKFSSHPGAPDVVLMHIVHCTDDLLHEDCRNHLSWPKIAIPRWCSPKHNGWSSFHMKVSILGYLYIYILWIGDSIRYMLLVSSELNYLCSRQRDHSFGMNALFSGTGSCSDLSQRGDIRDPLAAEL
jgi:hypothetical protein